MDCHSICGTHRKTEEAAGSSAVSFLEDTVSSCWQFSLYCPGFSTPASDCIRSDAYSNYFRTLCKLDIRAQRNFASSRTEQTVRTSLLCLESDSSFV